MVNAAATMPMVNYDHPEWPFIFNETDEGSLLEEISLAALIAKNLKNMTKGKTSNTRSIVDLLTVWGFKDLSCNFLGAGRNRLNTPKRLINKMPRPLMRAYDDLRYHSSDIANIHAFYTRTPIFLSDLFRQLMRADGLINMKKINLKIHSLYFAFGFEDFYLVPIIDGDNANLFTIGLRTPEGTELLKQII